MNIIADTNIFLAVALNEPEKEQIIEITSEALLIAPESLPFEIGNALSAMIKRRQITKQEALAAENFTQNIQVRLVPVEIQSCLQLAIKKNIYAYDAYFLQCAISLSYPLLTLDNRMRQLAEEMGIEVLEGTSINS